MLTRFRILLSCLLVVSLVLLVNSGCLKKSLKPPVQNAKIRLLATPQPTFYAPHYVAINKGYFSQAGLEIEPVTLQPDLILNGAEAIFLNSAKQTNPTKLYAFAQLTKRDSSFLLSRKALPDFQWSALKGKTILGFPKDSISGMVLDYLLQQNQLIPQKNLVIVRNIPPQITTGAFQNGSGHFIQLSSPAVTQLSTDQTGLIVAALGSKVGELPSGTYLATEEYLKSNPETIQKFTNAVYRAQLWVANHTAAEVAQVITPSFPEIKPELLLASVKLYKEQQVWSGDPLPKTKNFEELQKIMLATGQIKEVVPAEQVIVTKFAKRALVTVKYEPEVKPGK